ncbi:16S rRNA (guanine(527)-N(7))-methyltransferase RsmG [Euzebya rosea]|uniref:16S rRNA (guanine(527)-N(7))-methyltransferase RsmG n=1 Tax=Euzebya rosea TaxID=2052804 RepID=UPI000D3EB33A|nr:16S rRNA (guanine(527)-N(7))-methyltransferase RsmG [Euzebya rosea]
MSGSTEGPEHDAGLDDGPARVSRARGDGGEGGASEGGRADGLTVGDRAEDGLGVGEQLALLGHLIAESPHNLVSARDRGLLDSVHIPECVAVVEAIHAGDGQHWIDLGTGGGLPGLVAAIMRPHVGWTLIDSRQKKVDAVNEFIEILGLENARAVAGRAEVLARQEEYRGIYDGVVSRAMARLDIVAELARGFLKPRGRLEVVKGPSIDQERGYFQRAASKLRMRENSTSALEMSDRGTVIVSLVAKGGPPTGVPRSDGLPQAKPLGGPKS